MIVTRTTDLSRDSLFAAIKMSLCSDYESATGNKLLDKDIKSGISYVKSFGKNKQNTIKITLKEFIESERYAVFYSSNRGKHLISYSLVTLESGDTQITCQQEVLVDGFFQQINQMLTNLLFKKSLEKRIDAQLQGLIHFTTQYMRSLSKG